MSRVVVLGLDGLPYSMLRRFIAEGVMPNMGRLVAQGDLKPMETVYPPLSSVSWTTFFTGVNPGAHRIFGFFEAQIDAYGIWFQDLAEVKMPALWDFAQVHGKRTVSINLPGTYPAPPFNGVMVSGFIAQDFDKSVYPKMLKPLLEKIDYMLDTRCDRPWEKPAQFWEGVNHALTARAKTIVALLQNEPFDLFIGVFTETDRVQHFFFDAIEEPNHPQHQTVLNFYRHVDHIVGKCVECLRADDELVILADHGFCRIEQEIYLNHWLKEHGYLVMKNDNVGVPLWEMDAQKSVAFALDPGRIYLNVKGRQADGCVNAADIPHLCDEIAEGLSRLAIKVPWQAEPFRPITHIFRREEIYRGPWAHLAADLVLHTADGYEMKGKFNHPVLHDMGNLTGMHTFGDAMLYVRGRQWNTDTPKMLDIAPTLLHLMGLPCPELLEGCNILH